MTEVEFSRRLSELTKTAEALNKESDSINDIIEKFEANLRKANVGIEVSVDIPTLDDVRLYWTKNPYAGDEWRLSTGGLGVLTERSRDVRIAALGAFPDLVDALKREAEWALDKIRNAKNFVK